MAAHHGMCSLGGVRYYLSRTAKYGPVQTMFSQAKYLLFGFVAWLHFQKIHTKISHICVSERQSEDMSNFPVICLETVAQFPRDTGKKSCLEGLYLHFSLLLSPSLSLFSSFFTLQTPKIIFSHCACFINGSSLSHLFILSEVGPMPCPSDCIVRVAFSWPK